MNRWLVPKILGIGIAGAGIGWLAEAVIGGWLIPPQWSVIIGAIAGLQVGRIVVMRRSRH